MYFRVCVQKLTAVCAVMWVQPTILAPANGFSPWALFLKAMRAGISTVQKYTQKTLIHGYNIKLNIVFRLHILDLKQHCVTFSGWSIILQKLHAEEYFW